MKLLWIGKPSSPLLRITLNQVRHYPSEIADEAFEAVAEDKSDGKVKLHNDDELNQDPFQLTGRTTGNVLSGVIDKNGMTYVECND